MGDIKKEFLNDHVTLVSLLFLILLVFLVLDILDYSWKPLSDYVRDHVRLNRRYCNHPIYGYSSHNGPATWKLCFPESTGENQSPINIDTKCCLVVNPCTALKTQNWEISPVDMSLENNGHTVVLMAEWNFDCTPTITGGPLGDAIYKFHCATFRWGPNDDEGSEHTIDNTRFCLEVQIINTRVKTNNNNGCFEDNDIAIVSFLYNVTEADNPYLDYIVNNLHRIKYPSSPLWIMPFPLKWLKKTASTHYYVYSGSLTYPPCCENVTWIVFPETVSISAQQVRKFRKLRRRDGEPNLTNTRPVQLLNSRSIFYYD